MGFSPARLEAIENADHLIIVELMEIGVKGVVRLNSSQRYLKFQDGDASRCVGYPRMVETRRVWRSE